MDVNGYDLRDDLKYDKNNNWIRIEGDTAVFGINDYGVKRAKDIAFIELPKQGDQVVAGKGCGQIESAKWAGEVVAPLSGEIIEINQGLADDPSKMNSDPYGAWIAKIKINPADAEGLMDVNAAAEMVRNAQN